MILHSLSQDIVIYAVKEPQRSITVFVRKFGRSSLVFCRGSILNYFVGPYQFMFPDIFDNEKFMAFLTYRSCACMRALLMIALSVQRSIYNQDWLRLLQLLDRHTKYLKRPSKMFSQDQNIRFFIQYMILTTFVYIWILRKSTSTQIKVIQLAQAYIYIVHVYIRTLACKLAKQAASIESFSWLSFFTPNVMTTSRHVSGATPAIILGPWYGMMVVDRRPLLRPSLHYVY